MSDQNAQMDPAAAAQQVLFQEVWLPKFAEKCAELQIPLPDEESLMAALETVSMLKSSQQRDTGNIVKAAHAALCEKAGVATPEQRKVAESHTKQAAAVAKSEKIQQALSVLAQLQAAQ